MEILGEIGGVAMTEGFFGLFFSFLASLAEEFHPGKPRSKTLLVVLDLVTSLWFLSPVPLILLAVLNQNGFFAVIAVISFVSYLSAFVLACQSSRTYFRSLYLPHAFLRR
jgi:hypothetical protein